MTFLLPKVPVFENKKITVSYIPSLQVIHHEMHDYCYGETLRNALDAGTEALKRNGATKWLSDDRKNGPLPADDLTWAAKWADRSREAGWKYWAVLGPEDKVGQMTIRRHMKLHASNGVLVEVFGNVEEALVWLRRQQ